MYRLMALCAALLTACAGPTAPSSSGFTYPPELQAVIDVIDHDPWQHPLIGEPMGTWVRRHTRIIVLDASLPSHIGARIDAGQRLIRWQPLNVSPTSTYNTIAFAGVLLHEVRHLEGHLHTCGVRDRTMTEGGAFAVHILYLEHWDMIWEANRLRRDFIGCH